MILECPQCGCDILIRITKEEDSNIQNITRSIEVSKQTGLAITTMPREGEAVLACISPFKITALITPSGTKTMKRYYHFFTASTIWRPSEEEKYQKVFIELIKEKKLMKVGLINDQLKVELSEDGIKWIDEMKKKEDIKMCF